jgi:hypothetical protein
MNRSRRGHVSEGVTPSCWILIETGRRVFRSVEDDWRLFANRSKCSVIRPYGCQTPHLHHARCERLSVYIAKAEKKGRTKSEVDAILCWLTGYTSKQLEKQLKEQTDFETFFAKAPKLNPARKLITGVICGVRVEDIEEPTMQEIRYLDKLVDELAKGRPMDKILRA